MSDIVKRLRRQAILIGMVGSDKDLKAMLEEAAAEIARLRQALNVVAACLSEMEKGLEKHLLPLPPGPETKEVPRE